MERTERCTYDWTKKSKETFLCLVKFLLSICLDVEGGLASLLVGGGVDFNLVFCHDLLHDLSESSGLSVLAGAKIDGREGE